MLLDQVDAPPHHGTTAEECGPPMKLKRREFLSAALTAGGAGWAHTTAEAQQAPIPPTPRRDWPSRSAKVEVLFTAPGHSGNGMQCTDEGIWTIDVAGSRTDTPGRCKVYLSSYDGKLLRELSPEGTGPSGIGVDEDHTTIWIGSTYSREIIRADAKTGETIEKHFTPGAGVIYRRTTDTPPRADVYGASLRAKGGTTPAVPATVGSDRAQAVLTSDGLGVGRGGAVPGNPGPPAPGTGAHGIQTQHGKLWIAVPPGRMVYRIDPATWTVEHMFPTVGYRPHGIGIETEDDKFLWEADTNMGGFFKRDMASGEVLDAIIIPEGRPFPHGASVWKGYIYWVDDVGGGMAPVCRTRI
jgi:streptogramin lyase